jgi:hypothetical protein
VNFYAQIEVSVDIIICKDVCVYPASDPPGIRRGSITKMLLAELRSLMRIGLELGYAEMYVQGKRTMSSSSAKPGKIVNIRRRRSHG